MTHPDNTINHELDEDLFLLKCIQSDDRNAYEIIYKKYNSILFDQAYRILRDRESSMDIVQEIFVWLWTNREFLEIKSLKPYLLAAVRFQVANFIRKNKVREDYLLNFEKIHANNPLIIKPSEISELKELIKDLTNLLPDRCREVFILSRQDHLPNKEIALKLGISEKTVEMHITLAIKKLRIGMRDYLNLLLILF